MRSSDFHSEDGGHDPKDERSILFLGGGTAGDLLEWQIDALQHVVGSRVLRFNPIGVSRDSETHLKTCQGYRAVAVIVPKALALSDAADIVWGAVEAGVKHYFFDIDGNELRELVKKDPLTTVCVYPPEHP